MKKNKHILFSLSLLIVCVMLSCRILAYDFSYNGIRYTIISETEQTVEVAAGTQSAGSDGPSLYKGDIVIPSSVDFGNRKYSVVGIGQSAFVNCPGISSVTLPNSLVYISKEAFQVCMGLKEITIPKNVESIGYDVFSITSISKITVLSSTPANVTYNAFFYPQSYNNCVLYVPYGSKRAYQNASEWNKFSSIIEMEKEPDVLDGHEYVDLGLPSGKLWATMNYGASNPEDYGSYVSWSRNDIVSSSWGASWITPTLADIKELEANCSWTWGSRSGINGYTVKGNNNNTIFIPAAGVKLGNLSRVGEWVYYWTSTEDVNYEDMAYIVLATSSDIHWGSLNYAFSQVPIRPVSKDGKAIPPTTYTLSIKTTGYGSVSYNGSTVRNTTSSFSVNEGANAAITFSPDSGYRIKSVKVGSSDVTSNISNNSYTVRNIQGNTTVAVEFEAIPPKTYTLTISATGNGFASYNGTTIRSKTSTFMVNEGTNATISFHPDNGYRIKSVKVGSSDVTASVSGNSYTVSNIQGNTTISVEFEAIPPTTYTLTISASGNGSASYNGTTIRSKTSTFTVNEGTNATISFNPDSGYRIKSVKVGSSDVTASVSGNSYTVSNIQGNTTISVEFEAIPPTTYILTISATGNGSVTFDGTMVRSKTSTFTVNEGTNATITFSPDSDYRIKSVKVGNTDVTASVSGNSHTISNIQGNTTVAVEFEAIPSTTYTLTISATGNGSASYNGTTVRSKTSTFTVNEGTNANITFSPDSGNMIKSVMVGNSDVTSRLSKNNYFVSNIKTDTSVEVTFAENITAFASQEVNYTVTSYEGKTINVASGDYGKVLDVPATVEYQGDEWTITGIDDNALEGNDQLAAIIWNAKTHFTATVRNPNLLLYVTDNSYAPTSIKNVIVNNTAANITLTDATSGNNFYCPQEFSAQRISYTHNYTMTTGIGEARGWETLALPFDVQQVKHENKGELTPFANWKSGNEVKPFWLMELSSSGWRETDRIMANTPYIVSMPNNEKYKEEFLLNGKVTFSAENATVRKSEDVKTVQYEGRTFIPIFLEIGEGDGAYALNVSNDYETNVSGVADGSRFVLNLRRIHPFEAYMQSSAKTRAFDISDGMGIVTNNEKLMIKVYNLKGQMLKHQEGTEEDIKKHLPKGLYIINGKKIIVR